MTSARVEMAGEARTVAAEEVLTFGRSERCTIVLRPYDEGLSRWAGSLRCEKGTWWLANESETRPFHVVDHVGFAHPVPPGARYAVDVGRAEVVLAGQTYRYCIAVTVTAKVAPATTRVRPSSGPPTAGAEDVLITPSERLALVALFAGYLEAFPWKTNEPATYKEAGARLHVSAAAVRKRIEHVRHKLSQAGVSDLWGPQARQHLAAYVIATRVIAPHDLGLLPPR